MTADEDASAPAKGDGYRRKQHAGRYLRADCTNLSPAQAKEWLTTYDPVATFIVKNLFRKNPHATLEYADLATIGRMAILEACQTFKHGAGGTLRTWVGNVIRWRVAAAVEEMSETWVVNLENFGTALYDPEAQAEWRKAGVDPMAHSPRDLDPEAQVEKYTSHFDPHAQIEAREELADFLDRREHGEMVTPRVFRSVQASADVEEALRVLEPPTPIVRRRGPRLARVG